MIQQLKALRNLWLQKVTYRNYTIGKNFYSGARVRIWGKDKIVIGDNFYIGRDSFIESDVQIGNNVMFGNRVAIVGRYDHHYQQPGVATRNAMAIRDKSYNWKGAGIITLIEDDVWVGYGSTILSGVTIGEGSVIAACSLVTKNVEPYCIYAGSPAIKVNTRFNTVEELHEHLSIVKSTYINKL